jgi:hypothetical protein
MLLAWFARGPRLASSAQQDGAARLLIMMKREEAAFVFIAATNSNDILGLEVREAVQAPILDSTHLPAATALWGHVGDLLRFKFVTDL